MIVATALASIGLFVVSLWALGIVRVAAGVIVIARGAVAAMRDEGIDDEAREKAVQRASVRLMRSFVSILLRSCLALFVSLLPIWLANSAELARSDDVLRYLSRWDVIAIVSLVLVAGYIIRLRLWPTK